MGSFIFAKRNFISSLECHAALSSRMYDDSYQPGVSWSRRRSRWRRNIVITSASVLAWVSAHQILPSVSRPKMSEILGMTCFSLKVEGASEGTQVRRRKRVWFSHDSSTLMIRVFFSSRGSRRSEYCCRRTRVRSMLL